MVEGWGRGPRGPSTLLIRAIPSNVEGWRALVVIFGNTADRGETSTADASTTEESADVSEARATEPHPSDGREGRPPREGARVWADLMRRSFGLDVLACPRCGGRLRLIALIEQAAVIERILRHLRLPTDRSKETMTSGPERRRRQTGPRRRS